MRVYVCIVGVYVLMWYSVATRNDFVEIMEMLDKRLNDKGKNWRHVFKVRHLRATLSLYIIFTYLHSR